jgi:hypothetical protein
MTTFKKINSLSSKNKDLMKSLMRKVPMVYDEIY